MTPVAERVKSSLLEGILAGTWTDETLPEILSREQRSVYQLAANALEDYAFPHSQAFDPQAWRKWLNTPHGRLCTAIDQRILQWDEADCLKT